MTTNEIPRIGYVLKRYPRLSETFILNEIAVMEQLGSKLVLFSLLQPEPPPHHPIVETIKAPLHYLPAAISSKAEALAKAHVASFLAEPLRYGLALYRALYSSLQSKRPLSVWKQFARAGFVADACRRQRVTLIHAHFANAPAAVAWFASAMTGIPYSFTTHAKDLYLTPKRVIRRRVHGARFVVSCTRYNVDYLRSFIPACERAKIRLVYHGIDVDRFANDPAVASQPSSHVPVILSVGRLVPKKGFPDLIAACQFLLQEGLRFRCVIVGEGPLRGAIEAEIIQRGLADVVSLKGAMTHADLIAFYREAAIFALSPCIVANGDRDGIPNVIAEAMAAGVPVVSTAVSGIPELIQNGITGLLVSPESPSELAAALRRLLRNPGDGRRLAHNARERIETQFNCMETTKLLRELMCDCACGQHGQIDTTDCCAPHAVTPATEAAE